MSHSKHPLRGLLIAQFLGAFNNNAWKLIVALLGINVVAQQVGGSGPAFEAASQAQTTIAFVVFTLPLMLVSIPAGVLADRLSKRTVLITMKAFEVLLIAGGTAVLLLGPSHWKLPLVVLGLMGVHSAFFSPAKYGILPEILPHWSIPRVQPARSEGSVGETVKSAWAALRDDRVLGTGAFVERLLQEADARLQGARGQAQRLAQAHAVIRRVCQRAKISLEELHQGSRRTPIAQVLARLAVDLVGRFGLSLADVARQLGISTSGIAKILSRVAKWQVNSVNKVPHSPDCDSTCLASNTAGTGPLFRLDIGIGSGQPVPRSGVRGERLRRDV